MKLIYVAIDGLGDLPVEELGNKTPLEFASTPNMDFLAEEGATGLMYTVKKGMAPESDVAVLSILGYDPFEYYTGRGPLEVVGSGMAMKDGDLALRCNFATLGNRGKIIDRRVGRTLTSKEAAELSKAVNEELKLESYPAKFELKTSIGYRAALIIRSEDASFSSDITNTDPAYSRKEGLGVAEAGAEMMLKKCSPTRETREARISAELVNEFTEKSHLILESHPINKERAAHGKLKANVILSRDAGHLVPKLFNINERYGVRFVFLAELPTERGIAKLAGMEIVDLPPLPDDTKKHCIVRAEKLLNLLPFYDCFYIHIKGPDEPGHDGKPHLKARIIADIDEHLFGNLLPKIDLKDHIVCVVSDHSTPCKLKAHSDDPVPLLITGGKVKADNVRKFSEKDCRRGSLGVLEHGTELMPKLMSLLKNS